VNTSTSSGSTHGEFEGEEVTTLTIKRQLPGPISRVWAYLTDSQLRSQWLAAGQLPSELGAVFELEWRNDRLSASGNERPEGFPEVQRAVCELMELDPPHSLRFRWPNVGDVNIVLEPAGDDVLLTLVHRGLVERTTKVMVAAGWHAHLEILVARVAGSTPPSFWCTWIALRSAYELRL
jgi:uncharacterized protein YndB with AHSA1/START domain